MADETKEPDQTTQAVEQPAAEERFPIVALGGSAGALEALQAFFGAQPVDSGCAFVVITHQHPKHESMLPEILDKATEMPVAEARDGTTVAPDHVYVAVPDGQLSIDDGVLVLGDPPGGVPGDGETTSGMHHPVDGFFRALAWERQERAIAVVLSGSGTDGAVGLKDIKAESGMVIVQRPETTAFDGMPTSALATGLVDHSLPPEELPGCIVNFVHGLAAHADDEVGVSDNVKDEIVALLHEHTGNDFSGYKRATLVRRIQRRMEIRHIERGSEYLDDLRNQPNELDHLFREAIVSVTRFFRDPAAWETLKEPLRQYIAALPDDGEFRAWVMGCATGEEAYTLAIVVAECMAAAERHLPTQILATDIEPRAIETAREGRYPAGIASDVPPELLERYFYHSDEHYIAHKTLRERILFAVHNGTQDPPFTRIDLVSCRNLLIYLEDGLQRRLQPVFHYALKPEGLLLLGTAETVDHDQYGNPFETVDRSWKIFRRGKQKTPQGALPTIPLRPTARGRGEPSRAGHLRGGETRPGSFGRTIERLLMKRYVPPSVIVSENGDAAYFHGHTGKLLAPSQGVPGNNILTMAREGLRSTLREALRAATGETTTESVHRRARVRTNGGHEWFTIRVNRIHDPESVRGLLLVSFQPESAADAGESEAAEDDADVDPGRVAQLERELEAVSAERSGTVEQLETTNEDLQAANEELQSANEELQSTNEELETSREEMESLNEELSAVNAELQDKIRQLERVNNDMSNMLNNTDLAIVFLGRDLDVRRFTDRAGTLIALRPSDIGRPIRDLASNLRYDRLVEDASEVLRTLQNRAIELQTKDGSWYLMRIMPYRTLEHEIDGVVCTFADIDDIKQAEYREQYFHGVVETVREPLVALDEQFRVVWASGNFYNAFALQAKNVEGETLFDLADGQWNQPELRRQLEEVLPRRRAFRDFELEADFAPVGRKNLLLNARQIERETGQPGQILLAIEERDRGERPSPRQS